MVIVTYITAAALIAVFGLYQGHPKGPPLHVLPNTLMALASEALAVV